jgi:hypothetical protein
MIDQFRSFIFLDRQRFFPDLTLHPHTSENDALRGNPVTISAGMSGMKVTPLKLGKDSISNLNDKSIGRPNPSSGPTGTSSVDLEVQTEIWDPHSNSSNIYTFPVWRPGVHLDHHKIDR